MAGVRRRQGHRSVIGGNSQSARLDLAPLLKVNQMRDSEFQFSGAPVGISQQQLGLVQGTRPLGKSTRRGRTPSYPGFFASTKALGPAPFASLLERDAQTILCCDPRVEDYAVQAHQLTYYTPGAQGGFIQRLYTPDLVVRLRGGRVVVIEVKSQYLAGQAYWREREPHIRAAYQNDYALPFVVMTERHIRVRPLLTNYKRMLRFGGRFEDLHALQRVRDVLERQASTILLGDICRSAVLETDGVSRAFSAVMRLALDGEVVLDHSTPISMSTVVTVGDNE